VDLGWVVRRHPQTESQFELGLRCPIGIDEIDFHGPSVVGELAEKAVPEMQGGLADAVRRIKKHLPTTLCEFLCLPCVCHAWQLLLLCFW
jgi:hypothetical protein